MRCPECRVDLKKNATSCPCGWNQTKANHDRPPTAEDELMKVIGRFIAHKPLPDFMPPAAINAARWWMTQQEPARGDEKPRQVSVQGSDDTQRWLCPYHTRIGSTLEKFLLLPSKDQRMILAAREDGIFWRGDDMIFFMSVIDQTEKMRKMGTKAYREESATKARDFVRQAVRKRA